MPEIVEVTDDGEEVVEEVERVPSLFALDDYVEIHGLMSATGSKMNGKTGKVTVAKDPLTGRYGVELQGSKHQGHVKQIKEENLKEGAEDVGFVTSEDEDGPSTRGRGGTDDMGQDDLADMMGGLDGLGGMMGGGMGGGKGGGKDDMMANLMAMMGGKGGGGKGGGKDDMMAQMMGMMGGKGGGKGKPDCPQQ
mmetsp:Transcript_101104/g.261304  ORF Transcript_101104/g.261304 Transcript_101104/m.261304 type:complete len:193 (+) Transcript_101104:91-669(+)